MENESEVTQAVLEAIKLISKVTKGQVSFQYYHEIERETFKKSGNKVTNINIQIRDRI